VGVAAGPASVELEPQPPAKRAAERRRRGAVARVFFIDPS
jgi:hypothetical protein